MERAREPCPSLTYRVSPGEDLVSAPRPNSYDQRQLRELRRHLTDALTQVGFMLEPGRSLVDTELRAIIVQGHATRAARVSRHIEKRFAAAHTEGEHPRP